MDVCCFDSIDEAVMGLAGFLRYERVRAKLPLDEEVYPLLVPPAVRRVEVPANPVLLGDEATALFKAYGVPVPPAELSQDVDAAVAFALTAGYPVVLKIVSQAWIHKSDQGGIRLHLKDERELRQAYEDLWRSFRSATPDAVLDGILVQKQARGFELLVGLKKDPQLGPVVLVGMGGIYTEVFQDVARGLVPLSRSEVREMLASLRCYPILAGVRGQQGVKMEAVENLLLSVSQLAMDYPEILEMDLNPVLASPDGCWCVDSRLVLDAKLSA
jgi:acetate---CoA ligase (ADP-forming)